jgi:hypothetical protein
MPKLVTRLQVNSQGNVDKHIFALQLGRQTKSWGSADVIADTRSDPA